MSDMHALNLSYHHTCLVAFNNRVCNTNIQRSFQNDMCFTSEEARAFAELASYIEVSRYNWEVIILTRPKDRLYIIPDLRAQSQGRKFCWLPTRTFRHSVSFPRSYTSIRFSLPRDYRGLRLTSIFSCEPAAFQMFIPSVCPSDCLSHFFDNVPVIVVSWTFQEWLLLIKVIPIQKVKVKGQRSRSQISSLHGTKNRQFFWTVNLEFIDGYEKMHKAYRNIEEMPFCFLGHPSNFKVSWHN